MTKDKLEWGVYLTTLQPPGLTEREVFKRTIAHASFAEELGYDAAWLLEHHFTRYGLCTSPLTLAAYIFGRTRKLKIGTAITTIPLEHPVRLAESVALLDQLSGGRFYFGIGRGSFVKDFKVFGVDMAHSREMMNQWVDIMQQAWTTGKCSSSEGFVQFPEIDVIPRPLTQPHPPIYVAATSPSTIEWAAIRGFPLMMIHLLEDETKVSTIEQYADVAAAHGHDPDSIPHMLSCITLLGDDANKVKAAARPVISFWMEELVRASELYAPENKNLGSYEHHQRRWEEMVIAGTTNTERRVDRAYRLNPVGTVQEVIDKLQHSIDLTGIRHVACGFEGFVEEGPVLENMQRFREEVMPHVKLRTR